MPKPPRDYLRKVGCCRCLRGGVPWSAVVRIAGLQQLAGARPAGGREDMANGGPVKAHADIALAVEEVTRARAGRPHDRDWRPDYRADSDRAKVAAVLGKIPIVTKHEEFAGTEQPGRQ